MKRRIAIITMLLTGVWCVNANAQFGDLLKKAKQKAKDAVGSKQPESTDSTTTTTTTTKTTTETTTTTAPADVNGQPNLTAARIDFVPGERTVFFDDFSDMAPDEPPPHWKVRGGTVSLKTGGGIRELAPAEGVNLTTTNVAFPKNFTFEAVMTGRGEIEWFFQNKDDSRVLTASVAGSQDGQHAHVNLDAHESLGEGEITLAAPDMPITFDLWVQEGRIRAYLNGERLIDVNDVNLKPITTVYADASRYRPTGLRSVRVAESAPDFSKLLVSSGKVVTHGIHFDTDSDRIEPDSAGVIRQVAGALDKNPTLKLEIDGYTDSVGNASHNADLSKRRAEAVKSVLVSQFNIDAARLTANGFGAGKPIATNDSADGRAANRRVEFVRVQ